MYRDINIVGAVRGFYLISISAECARTLPKENAAVRALEVRPIVAWRIDSFSANTDGTGPAVTSTVTGLTLDNFDPRAASTPIEYATECPDGQVVSERRGVFDSRSHFTLWALCQLRGEPHTQPAPKSPPAAR